MASGDARKEDYSESKINSYKRSPPRISDLDLIFRQNFPLKSFVKDFIEKQKKNKK